MAGALARHRGWLRHRSVALARRLSPHPGFRYRGRVTVERATETVSFDTGAGTLSSKATLSVRALATLSSLYLQVPRVVVGGATVSDSAGPLEAFDRGAGLYLVSLRQPLSPGESLDLHVDTSGAPICKSPHLGLVVCQIEPDLVFALGVWSVAVYDATARELLRPASSTLKITVSGEVVVGATGLSSVVSETPDGSRTFTFEDSDNLGYSFCAAPYVTGTLAFGDGKTTTTFLLPDTASTGAAWRDAVADVMAFHAARYGPYDPKKIDVVELPDIAGAAFGPFTAIFMPTSALRASPTDRTAMVTLAHELGHQWFGGLIRGGDPRSPWLNEGFASFAEMEYTADRVSARTGEDFRADYRAMSAQGYIYSTQRLGLDMPMSSAGLSDAPADLYLAVTYTKGAMAVHMLRYLLGGDAPFYAAVRAYRADHAGGRASAESLQASLTGASGVDLARVFEKYVFGTGYPTYRVAVQRDGASARIVVTADEDFGMPVELEIVSADGESARVRVPVSAADPRVFEHSASAAAEVLSVRVDPDRQILGRTLGDLPGDIHLNGAVDGIDLIYAAMAQGERHGGQWWGQMGFPDWADLVLDGAIDGKDLDRVLGAFGKRQGE